MPLCCTRSYPAPSGNALLVLVCEHCFPLDRQSKHCGLSGTTGSPPTSLRHYQGLAKTISTRAQPSTPEQELIHAPAMESQVNERPKTAEIYPRCSASRANRSNSTLRDSTRITLLGRSLSIPCRLPHARNRQINSSTMENHYNNIAKTN